MKNSVPATNMSITFIGIRTKVTCVECSVNRIFASAEIRFVCQEHIIYDAVKPEIHAIATVSVIISVDNTTEVSIIIAYRWRESPFCSRLKPIVCSGLGFGFSIPISPVSVVRIHPPLSKLPVFGRAFELTLATNSRPHRLAA